jgi:hypothetical protein
VDATSSSPPTHTTTVALSMTTCTAVTSSVKPSGGQRRSVEGTTQAQRVAVERHEDAGCRLVDRDAVEC